MKEAMGDIMIIQDNECTDEEQQVDDNTNDEINREINQNEVKLLRHNNEKIRCNKFPSEASSELTNQEATPTGSAVSTDQDQQTPLFAATDHEANSSAHFYPFAFGYSSSSLVQVNLLLTAQFFNTCYIRVFGTISYMLLLIYV